MGGQHATMGWSGGCETTGRVGGWIAAGRGRGGWWVRWKVDCVGRRVGDEEGREEWWGGNGLKALYGIALQAKANVLQRGEFVEVRIMGSKTDAGWNIGQCPERKRLWVRRDVKGRNKQKRGVGLSKMVVQNVRGHAVKGKAPLCFSVKFVFGDCNQLFRILPVWGNFLQIPPDSLRRKLRSDNLLYYLNYHWNAGVEV
eukprot:765896-Hanusia_phi.AAC.3